MGKPSLCFEAVIEHLKSGMDAKFAVIKSKFADMDAKYNAVNSKLNSLRWFIGALTALLALVKFIGMLR